MNQSLIEIVRAAAKRFDDRPIYRASIDAQTELQYDFHVRARELREWRRTWGLVP